MGKPKLLDLFCGAGGSAAGYAQAGFEVVGVDNRPQPNYPYTFILADALEFLAADGLAGFDAAHASCPCQAFSTASLYHHVKARHPNLIPATRSYLEKAGIPYVIENVAGAPLHKAIMLCGTMFGLQVYRHRYFESNLFLFQPDHLRHTAKASKPGAIPKPGEFWSPVGNFGHKNDAQRAMGIDWMRITGSKDREIAQAIPPAYTKWIGAQLMAAIDREVACG